MANDNTMKIHIVYGIFILLIVGIFSYVVLVGNKSGSLKVIIGDTEVDINLAGDSLSVRSMLDTLFKDDDTKRESTALLKEFGGYYEPADPAIVEVIAQQDVQSEVSVRLRNMLDNLRGPFDRSLHTFYDIQDADIVDAIETLGYEHAVSYQLRELLAYRRGPFEEKAKEVLLSVPEGDNIPSGRAASCTSNEFYRKEIRIYNKLKTNSVSVYVSSRFLCPEIENGDDNLGRLIQLPYEEMEKLIGDSPLAELESGFAEIIVEPQ